eukprot:814430-Pyramimonas_sp.AAC.1
MGLVQIAGHLSAPWSITSSGEENAPVAAMMSPVLPTVSRAYLWSTAGVDFHRFVDHAWRPR